MVSGRGDINGEDWARIFAESIGGLDHASPLGLADVSWNGCCWSLKTVKNKRPYKAKTVRLIAGRNSPQYSGGISDPLQNIAETGRIVLSIYNNRLAEARTQHSDVRLGVLLRNMEALEFAFYERHIVHLHDADYEWRKNRNGNLEAYSSQGVHTFTWQPHGSQFTIKDLVPLRTTRIRILQRPGVASLEDVLQSVGFSDEWVEVIQE